MTRKSIIRHVDVATWLGKANLCSHHLTLANIIIIINNIIMIIIIITITIIIGLVLIF